jgi:hypothetical protein
VLHLYSLLHQVALYNSANAKRLPFKIQTPSPSIHPATTWQSLERERESQPLLSLQSQLTSRPVTVGQRLSLRVRTTSPSASSRPTPRPGLFTRFCTRTITTAQHQATYLSCIKLRSFPQAGRHERGAGVDGGRLLRDAGAGAGRPGPVAGGVLVVGVPVAAVPPRRARAAARRARGPGAPRRVAPPARRRRVAGRVHGRGVAPLRRVPGAPPRRSRRRELRGKRRPARVPAHAGALQPPPLPTGR